MHFDSLICWSDATAPGVVCHVDRPISPDMVRTVEVAAYPRGIKMDRTSGHRAIKAKQHPTYLLACLTYLDPAEPTWWAGVPGLGRAIVLLESTALSSCALGRLRVARGCACGRPVGDAGSPNRRPRARLNGAEGPCLGPWRAAFASWGAWSFGVMFGPLWLEEHQEYRQNEHEEV